MKKVLFTGAHHNSALALLDWLKSNSSEELGFVWVGKKYLPNSVLEFTPEYREVSDRNIKFYDIKAGKIYRFTDIRFLLLFFKNLLLIPGGFYQAFKILRKEKPDLIVSFGGYIAVPIVIMGYLFRIKSVSHEQTLSIGLANQLIYLFAEKIYTAWPLEYYPASYRDKMYYVGLPLRQKFLHQIELNEKFKFKDEKPVIYVTGGKNGSHTINRTVLFDLTPICKNFNLIWACGGLQGNFDYERLLNEIKSRNLENQIIIKPYFDENEIGKVFNTADIVIARSGAHTVYELIFLNKPSILIPIPWSSNHEQFKNARVLEEAGLGMVLEEQYLSTGVLFGKLEHFYKNINSFRNSKIQVNSNSSQEMGNEVLQKFL